MGLNSLRFSRPLISSVCHLEILFNWPPPPAVIPLSHLLRLLPCLLLPSLSPSPSLSSSFHLTPASVFNVRHIKGLSWNDKCFISISLPLCLKGKYKEDLKEK